MGDECRWYAVYTTPRAEKKVATRLNQSGVKHYLPLQKELKQWSDRRKWVEEPLLKSYVFVNIADSEYHKVLNTAGVVRFVTFGGKAASIPDYQIETLRRLLMQGIELEVLQEHLQPGDPIEVIAGPLMGTLGELVSHRGEKRVAVKIHTLDTSVLINIPEPFIEPLKDPQKLELLDSLRNPKFAWNT